MTPEQVNLIRKSFDEMWPIRRNLAVRFYNRFFEIAPDAQRLFPSNMERLHLKLMDTIAAIVAPSIIARCSSQLSVTRPFSTSALGWLYRSLLRLVKH